MNHPPRSKNNELSKSPENDFLPEISKILQAAKTKSYHVINTAMIETYWLIGKRIVEQEQP